MTARRDETVLGGADLVLLPADVLSTLLLDGLDVASTTTPRDRLTDSMQADHHDLDGSGQRATHGSDTLNASRKSSLRHL